MGVVRSPNFPNLWQTITRHLVTRTLVSLPRESTVWNSLLSGVAPRALIATVWLSAKELDSACWRVSKRVL